jgi:hypothetical protein
LEITIEEMERIFNWLQQKQFISASVDKIGRRRFFKNVCQDDFKQLMDPNVFYHSKESAVPESVPVSHDKESSLPVYKKRKVSVVQKDLAVF